MRGVVDRVRAAGWETVGEIVDYESTFLLCYVRGPEGLIVEFAERLDRAPRPEEQAKPAEERRRALEIVDQASSAVTFAPRRLSWE